MVEKDNQQTRDLISNEQNNVSKVDATFDKSENVEVDKPEPHESIEHSKKKNKTGKKAVKITLVALAFVGVLFLGLYLGGFFNGNDPKADPKKFTLAGGEDYDPDKYKSVAMQDDIAFCSFEKLNFKAGRRKQVDCGLIQNPKQNTVFMKVSLSLKTSKYTDEVIWETGDKLLEPGLAYNTITLKRPLKKGKYKAVLKYDCFSVKDLSQQNGSQMNITLDVK